MTRVESDARAAPSVSAARVTVRSSDTQATPFRMIHSTTCVDVVPLRVSARVDAKTFERSMTEKIKGSPAVPDRLS